MELEGLHHVTAVTGNASMNVAFYTKVLGMRLVKRTVNQDDVSAYHLFYADAEGRPGTEITFFDWPHIGPNVPGTGMITAIRLRVHDRETLEWWSGWLRGFGVQPGKLEERDGVCVLPFQDPEGQHLELVEDGGLPGGIPWRESRVPPERAIKGLHSVVLTVDSLLPTERTLVDIMGFRKKGEYTLPEAPSRKVYVYETGPGGPGAEVHVEERPEMPSGRLGIGGVHHVAFRTPNDEEHRRWRNRVASEGLGVTPIIDRFYFKSIYFREPEGVLFEIATDGPGFAADEDLDHLGEKLSLPPFLEPYREQIEAGLRPIDPSPYFNR